MHDEPKNGAIEGLASGKRPHPSPTKLPRGLFSVVGIGASAGGLDACQHFLDVMPQGQGLAFILVQHLDPTHPSLMVELLASHTAMQVEQAEDGVIIVPDHVYVIPPGQYLAVKAGKLSLSIPNVRHGARLPFDFLLHSLAGSYGTRAQALILSGTGADGSIGLLSIKEQGGFVIAQAPGEASSDGMPSSAIATRRVDQVLELAAIPQALIERARAISRQKGDALPVISSDAEAPDLLESETLGQIIALLRNTTPHDFTTYKVGTLHRRIRRRAMLAGSTNLEAYLELLRDNPEECTRLANDMLINVTAFFRDPKVFALLENQIIPEIILKHGSDDPLRIWIVGCSTGEEAYSIAILFREALATLGSTLKLQVFASDADPDAVAAAREGFYPESSLSTLPPERRKRFFNKEVTGYRVLPELRAVMVFTVQDVLSDPPFSRLDFVSCRNLLIYLGPEAQEMVISLLHFALKAGGIMLLGSAETPGTINGQFEIISKAERLYRHIGRKKLSEFSPFLNRAGAAHASIVPKQSVYQVPRQGFAELCRQAVLESYAPAAMLINTAYVCLFSLGPIAHFLNVSSGYPTQNLIDMVPFGLRTRLKVAIRAMGPGKAKIRIDGGLDADGRAFYVDMQALVMDGEALILVAFVTRPVNREGGERKEIMANQPGDAAHIQDLEQQLALTRTELADAIRMLEQTNEEQKAVHEEALSVNEEFQSTNEELLTSKEELQSLNEELTALNNQLHETLERQRSTANDLQNILHSTHVATLFLDLDLKIRYFTPATRALFNVIPGDIGRPLSDLASLAVDAALSEEAQAVMASLLPVEREVQVADGTWFLRRILPYRADDQSVEGVVITFTDISDRKEIEKALEVIAIALEEAKKQAEAANIAKSRFLAAASHDLRQPLQSLTLIQGLLAKNVESDRGRQLVERLEQTLGAISGMINTLLDINQIETGMVEAQMVSFPVCTLLERMKDEFLFVAQAQKLELRVVGSSWVIHSDPSLLEQMLRNLISNALKYTRHGKVLLGCRQHVGGISIEVWDTGIGIPESQHQAIFQEYHQIGNDARARVRGMGLGLAIVRRLGDLLGHKIEVRSHVGRGSVFSIKILTGVMDEAIPIAPATPFSLATPPRRLGTLLVVEDDPEVSELLEMHLTGEGHRITTAKDGATALALVARTGLKPDMLLADYNLPNGMDGLALASKLRALLHDSLPVIILTGDIASETLKLIANGNAIQLNKPVSIRELSAAIQKKLEKAAYRISGTPVPPATRGNDDVIYVVDDDAAIREYLSAALNEAGRVVFVFPTCEAFLAGYRPGRGACLLLDAYLPGMSGIELLQRLRADENNIPAIMITGRSDVAIAVEAMKAGAIDFIEKPVSAPRLLASIGRALELGQETSQRGIWREAANRKIALLTKRQREILDKILAGHPNKNIAADLGISQRTIENHRAAIMKKTGSKSLPALARLAFAANPVA